MKKPFSLQCTIFDDDSDEEVIEPETVAEFDSQEEAICFLNHLIEVAKEHGFRE